MLEAFLEQTGAEKKRKREVEGQGMKRDGDEGSLRKKKGRKKEGRKVTKKEGLVAKKQVK